mgnify:CR=1 FL=1
MSAPTPIRAKTKISAVKPGENFKIKAAKATNKNPSQKLAIKKEEATTTAKAKFGLTPKTEKPKT